MVRERSDAVPSEPEALRPWRSGACRARRLAQTAPNRGKAPAPGRRTARGSEEPVFDGRHAGRACRGEWCQDAGRTRCRVGSGGAHLWRPWPAMTGITAACMADGSGHDGDRQRGNDDRRLSPDGADLRRCRQRPPSGHRALAAGPGGSRAAGSGPAAGKCDFQRGFDWPRARAANLMAPRTADHAGAQRGKALGRVLDGR